MSAGGLGLITSDKKALIFDAQVNICDTEIGQCKNKCNFVLFYPSIG